MVTCCVTYFCYLLHLVTVIWPCCVALDGCLQMAACTSANQLQHSVTALTETRCCQAALSDAVDPK